MMQEIRFRIACDIGVRVIAHLGEGGEFSFIRFVLLLNEKNKKNKKNKKRHAWQRATFKLGYSDSIRPTEHDSIRPTSSHSHG